MLLVVDIGNTQIVTGVFSGKQLVADWRLATDRLKTADEYGILIKSLFRDREMDPGSIDGAIISSVAPPVTGWLEQMVSRYFNVKPLMVEAGIKTGLSIKIENPREVGADRVVNAVAAIQLYGAPLIIVDFGTATTFCAIGPNGDYLGGAIAPGLGIASEALFEHTAKLQRIEIARPRTAIGKNTPHSLQSGLFFGYLGLVEGLIVRFKTEMNCQPKVIATGGLAETVAAGSKLVDTINPHLTLEGLRMIYEMNA
jgi:type III pantothenate kinase